MAVLNATIQNFEDIIKADKPSVVEFSAKWCVYCRRLEPAVERVSESMADKINVAKVDIDDMPDIAQKYNINTIPALMLFKNGLHGDVLVGPPSQNAVEEWINKQI